MKQEKEATIGTKISPAEIKRVKGLGCLKDKRYDDMFNIRVITRNGRITTDEYRAIADAAEKFGNGEITMTTRLSLEIQGVPYDNLEGAIAFLGEHGLFTGGTGAKVRPIVSCKGTTCQYGLIDTFSLSEKIHERFYVGYHDVALPHKFKIAVESIVQKGMDNLMKGRTVFVIAHRLSTIRNSDAIIVLDHGKIIERGDHEDLIRQHGTYYQLYR